MNITLHTTCTHLSPLTLQNLNGDISVVQALAVIVEPSQTDGSILVQMFKYSNQSSLQLEVHCRKGAKAL